MAVSTAFAPNQPHQPATDLKHSTTKQLIISLPRIAQRSLGGIILSVALTGIASACIFIVIAQQDLSSSATVLDRLLIAAIAFVGWSCFQLPKQQSSSQALDKAAIAPRDWLLFGIAGLSYAASLSCSAWSLTQTSVANSALLNNMMPIFTTLGAWLFLKQRFSLRFVVGLLVAIAGVMMIGIQDLHISSQQIVGDAAALLAAVLLATAILGIEQLRVKFSTSSIMMGICSIGSVAIVPVLWLSGDTVLPTSWASGLAVLALALICQVIGHGLLTYSLKQFSSGLVSVSMLSVPMLSAVLAMVLFSEKLNLINWCAFAIVLAGIYLSISANQLSVNRT